MNGMLLTWIILNIILFALVLRHIVRLPIVRLSPTSHLPPSTSTLKQAFLTFRTYGLHPLSSVQIGNIHADLAFVDAKVVYIRYKAEDLLQPKRRQELERNVASLIKDGWTVWYMRDKELKEHFTDIVHEIVVTCKQKSVRQ
ncbi:hypothetical protein N781_13515 [Pontibacillus halophilus JSM 076056 = DSM 19796]|uniref:DUF559 domain-containing protein n=1 Tax=Pontibacillus halophilus JSM 076056 = DSM 19796 TaxID=1385510 RepID=A0A0A5IB48_9BACI|nr:hypothetical protein [Pontibacillus halophilus]KGX93047.1 hypothetical protein N781_13515 [Pontibacillus halophilus JSM 076056 = DSM 19796]